MAGWKVALIVALAGVCLVLAVATVVIPIAQEGGAMWAWLGGLLAATAGAGALLVLFMKHAGRSLDQKPRGARR